MLLGSDRKRAQRVGACVRSTKAGSPGGGHSLGACHSAKRRWDQKNGGISRTGRLDQTKPLLNFNKENHDSKVSMGCWTNGGCSKFLCLETAANKTVTFANLSRIHRRAVFIAQVRKSQLLSASVVREIRFPNSSCKVATFHHRGST